MEHRSIADDALAQAVLTLAFPGYRIERVLGRVDDSLYLQVRDRDMRPLRLREYAPAGAVRGGDGLLSPGGPAHAALWRRQVNAFVALGTDLSSRTDLPVLPVLSSRPIVGEQGNVGGIWIEAAQPETLTDLMALGAPEARQVLALARDIAAAVRALHGAGLVHRNISPDVVVPGDGLLVLADPSIDNRDFIAVSGRHDGAARAGYSPIETYSAGEALGPAADIYGASAVIHRLVTGEAPPPATVRAGTRTADLPALDRAAGYPAALLIAVRRGLAIWSEERIGGDEWAALLGVGTPPATAAGTGSVAGRAAVDPPARAARPRRRRRIAAVAAILVVLALAAGIAAWRWGSPSGEREPAPTNQPVPVHIGSMIAAPLTSYDRQDDGTLADPFVYRAAGGETLLVRVTGTGFAPQLRVDGPGLPAAGLRSDASGQLRITLPAPSDYRVTVSATRPGDYRLEVTDAPAEAPRVTAATDSPPAAPSSASPAPPPSSQPAPPAPAPTLAGRWHGPGDPGCRSPASNRLSGAGGSPRVGDQLTSAISGTTFVYRIERIDGRRIETRLTNTRLAGRLYVFDLSADGGRYEVEGERWRRCSSD